ncbi:MAG: hypothetical protein IPL61_18835 [Myxococcales bacterium]|nr:hypothetical protein [Myxococcales bacterium]
MGEKDPSRRASDDTRARIDRLAGGWDVPDRPADPAPAPTAPAAPTPPTPAASPARTSATTRPPPLPPRRDRPSAPPPVAPSTELPPVIIASRADPTDAERDDDTRVDPRGDAIVLAEAARAPVVAGASLPVRATFRRRRGLSGDVAYVATVLFGSAASRRELRRLEGALAARQAERERALIALGADGVADPGLASARMVAARDALAELEEARAGRSGQAAAADADAAAIERNHKGELDKQHEAVRAIDAELVAIAGRLAPLEREAEGVRKQGDALRATLTRQDDALRAHEAKAVAMRGKAERAGVEAEIATLRAERVAIARDEPALAAQLAALTPRIAGLEADRTDAQRRLADAKAAIIAAGERAADELGAVAATRRVIERGVADLEKQRDRALRDLGSELAIERPTSLASALAVLDAADLAIATDDRRAMELREMLATVDRKALARGVAAVLVVLGVVGAATWVMVVGR